MRHGLFSLKNDSFVGLCLVIRLTHPYLGIVSLLYLLLLNDSVQSNYCVDELLLICYYKKTINTNTNTFFHIIKSVISYLIETNIHPKSTVFEVEIFFDTELTIYIESGCVYSERMTHLYLISSM